MDFGQTAEQSLPPNAAARYVNLSLIGQGGMGAVLRAYDSLLQRDVAIKIIRSHLCEDRRIKRRFRREVQSLASVKHPNIVRFYDFEEEEGVSYFTMEFVEGESLATLIADGALTKRRVVELIKCLASGLHAVHQAGMLHRDIKPENVVVTADGELKLIDFGLVKFTDKTNVTALTKQREFVGTLRYLAPEVLGGGEVDVKSDVYQVGLVLYEAIAGLHPLAGQSINALAEGTAYEEITPIEEVVPGVDDTLIDLIDRALAKERDERMDSLAELVDGLQDWLDKGKRSATRAIEGAASSGGLVAIDRAAILQGLTEEPSKATEKGNERRAKKAHRPLSQSVKRQSANKNDDTLIESAVSKSPMSMPKALRNLLIVGFIGLIAIIISQNFRTPDAPPPEEPKPTGQTAAVPIEPARVPPPSPTAPKERVDNPKNVNVTALSCALLASRHIRTPALQMGTLIFFARRWSRRDQSELVFSLLNEASLAMEQVASTYTQVEEMAEIASLYAREGRDKAAIEILDGLVTKAETIKSPWYGPAAYAVVGGTYGFTSQRSKGDVLLARAHKGALDYAVAFPADKAEMLLVQVALGYGLGKRVDEALQLLNTLNSPSKRYEALKKLAKACYQVEDFSGALKVAKAIDVLHARIALLLTICEAQEKAGVVTGELRAMVAPLLSKLRPTLRVATLWTTLAERHLIALDNEMAEKSLRQAVEVAAKLPAAYEQGKALSQAARVAWKLEQQDWARGLLKDAKRCSEKKTNRRSAITEDALLHHLVVSLGQVEDIKGAVEIAKSMKVSELGQTALLDAVAAACKAGELHVVDSVAGNLKFKDKLALARSHLYGAHYRVGAAKAAEQAFNSVFSACKGLKLATQRSKVYLELCERACELGDIRRALRAMLSVAVVRDKVEALILITAWQRKKKVLLTSEDHALLQKLMKQIKK